MWLLYWTVQMWTSSINIGSKCTNPLNWEFHLFVTESHQTTYVTTWLWADSVISQNRVKWQEVENSLSSDGIWPVIYIVYQSVTYIGKILSCIKVSILIWNNKEQIQYLYTIFILIFCLFWEISERIREDELASQLSQIKWRHLWCSKYLC